MSSGFNSFIYVPQLPILSDKLYNSPACEKCNVTNQIHKTNTLETAKLQRGLNLYKVLLPEIITLLKFITHFFC